MERFPFVVFTAIATVFHQVTYSSTELLGITNVFDIIVLFVYRVLVIAVLLLIGNLRRWQWFSDDLVLEIRGDVGA